MGDEARARILERRAAFVAAALAACAVEACSKPKVCLDVDIVADDASVKPSTSSASPGTGALEAPPEAGAPADAKPDAPRPRACLSMKPRDAAPMVCLELE